MLGTLALYSKVAFVTCKGAHSFHKCAWVEDRVPGQLFDQNLPYRLNSARRASHGKIAILSGWRANRVHKGAPDAAIAFNTVPHDSADAAARWLEAGSRAV